MNKVNTFLSLPPHNVAPHPYTSLVAELFCYESGAVRTVHFARDRNPARKERWSGCRFRHRDLAILQVLRMSVNISSTRPTSLSRTAQQVPSESERVSNLTRRRLLAWSALATYRRKRSTGTANVLQATGGNQAVFSRQDTTCSPALLAALTQSLRPIPKKALPVRIRP